MSSFKVRLRVPPGNGRPDESPAPSTPDTSMHDVGESDVDDGDPGAEDAFGTDDVDPAEGEMSEGASVLTVDELEDSKEDSPSKKKRSGSRLDGGDGRNAVD